MTQDPSPRQMAEQVLNTLTMDVGYKSTRPLTRYLATELLKVLDHNKEIHDEWTDRCNDLHNLKLDWLDAMSEIKRYKAALEKCKEQRNMFIHLSWSVLVRDKNSLNEKIEGDADHLNKIIDYILNPKTNEDR